MEALGKAALSCIAPIPLLMDPRKPTRPRAIEACLVTCASISWARKEARAWADDDWVEWEWSDGEAAAGSISKICCVIADARRDTPETNSFRSLSTASAPAEDPVGRNASSVDWTSSSGSSSSWPASSWCSSSCSVERRLSVFFMSS